MRAKNRNHWRKGNKMTRFRMIDKNSIKLCDFVCLVDTSIKDLCILVNSLALR